MAGFTLTAPVSKRIVASSPKLQPDRSTNLVLDCMARNTQAILTSSSLAFFSTTRSAPDFAARRPSPVVRGQCAKTPGVPLSVWACSGWETPALAGYALAHSRCTYVAIQVAYLHTALLLVHGLESGAWYVYTRRNPKARPQVLCWSSERISACRAEC